MKSARTHIIRFSFLLFVLAFSQACNQVNIHNYKIGQAIDSLNHVTVYYNGEVGHVLERNVAKDGYNLGLKYQCVEFVKRYYYEYYKHKMPDSYGDAIDFFNASLKDGAINPQRNLIQYTNPSKSKPEVGDLIIFNGTSGNKYGHVAIVSEVKDDEVQIIQQNPGPGGSSRVWMDCDVNGQNKYEYSNSRVLGWLRMK